MATNNNIGVYFDHPDPLGYPFDGPDGPNDTQAHWELAQKMEELGADVFMVRDPSTYEGDGNFSKSWKYGDRPGEFEEAGPVKIDTLFDRGNTSDLALEGVARVINHPMINEIATNKRLTAEVFVDVSPRTAYIEHIDQLAEAAGEMRTDRVVIKPRDGREGKGILFPERETVIAQGILAGAVELPAVVQEFIDTSKGIPDITEGIHDLRTVMVNGEPVRSYVRTPAEGSLLANIAAGGSMEEVPVNELPDTYRSMAKQIDDKLREFGDRIYSIDGVVDNNGDTLLMELNSRTGMGPQEIEGEPARYEQQKIAEALVG